jgi:hypothetical protein
MSIDKRGYKGLYIVDTTAFLRPVQIVRQFISNLGMLHSPIDAYHRYKGLSSLPQKARESRRITTIPIDITNPICLIQRFG